MTYTLARKKTGHHFVDDLDSFTGRAKLCLVGSSHTMEIGGSSGAAQCIAWESMYGILE